MSFIYKVGVEKDFYDYFYLFLVVEETLYYKVEIKLTVLLFYILIINLQLILSLSLLRIRPIGLF
jgi:hypothetical protein